jgi:hypothetical protein
MRQEPWEKKCGAGRYACSCLAAFTSTLRSWPYVANTLKHPATYVVLMRIGGVKEGPEKTWSFRVLQVARFARDGTWVYTTLKGVPNGLVHVELRRFKVTWASHLGYLCGKVTRASPERPIGYKKKHRCHTLK